MGEELTFFQSLHSKTPRNYLERMQDDKVECMRKAREFGPDFWDGQRRYGYGGYRYDGRWKDLAQKLITRYGLDNNSSILDVGCGKGHLLFEIQQLLPKAHIAGFDVSAYALEHAKKEIQDALFLHHAESAPYPYENKSFDLVISLNTLHNLRIFDLKTALQEIERIGKNSYIVVEGYRNEEELFNLQCWALTCESFFRPEEWCWIFNTFGYTGDYEYIYFN